MSALAPAGVVLEVNIRERLAVVAANDEAGVVLLDGPGRREAAGQRLNSLKFIEVPFHTSGLSDRSV
jgi:hypothetical protein